jgi:transcriptional regulator with XRE-family HTH domain
MEKVKALLRAGASASTAVREALGCGLAEFARRYDLDRTQVTNAINGVIRPTPAIIAALIAELEGSEEEWRALLWVASKPDKVPAEFVPMITGDAA